MALKGSLKDFALMDIFQLLGSGKKTGTLHLINSESSAEGTVCFYEGRVFFASSNWHTEPLGERLVAAGQVTLEQLDAALAQQQKEGGAAEGRKLGEILVEEAGLSTKSLQTFVQNQIHDSLFDLFRWEDGQVEFRVGEVPVDQDIGISVSVENVIMEASRRLESWESIKKKIPSMDTVFAMSFIPSTKQLEIHLKPSEWKLLCWVDGETDINGILHSAHMDDFRACQILYGMLCAGLIEKADEPLEERLRKLDFGMLEETTAPLPAALYGDEGEGPDLRPIDPKVRFHFDRQVSPEVLDRLIAVVDGL